MEQAVTGFFADHLEDDFARVKVSRLETTETHHGRIEKRSYFQVNVPDDLPGRPRWKGLRTLGLVIRTREVVPSPPSPLRADIVSAMAAISTSRFNGAPVVPEMSTGATDGLFTRNAGIPTYGVSGLAFDQNEPSRAHGRDERIGVESFHASVAAWEQLVQKLAGPVSVVP